MTEPATRTTETPLGFSYGKGKFPLLLVLLWLGFFAWFFWFVIEYQLPDFRKAFPSTETAAPAPK